MGIFDRVLGRPLDRYGFAQRVRRLPAALELRIAVSPRHRVRRYPTGAEFEALGAPSGL